MLKELEKKYTDAVYELTAHGQAWMNEVAVLKDFRHTEQLEKLSKRAALDIIDAINDLKLYKKVNHQPHIYKLYQSQDADYDGEILPRLPYKGWHKDGIVGVVNLRFYEDYIKILDWLEKDHYVVLKSGYCPNNNKYSSNYLKRMAAGSACVVIVKPKGNEHNPFKVLDTSALAKLIMQMQEEIKVRVDYYIFGSQLLIQKHPQCTGNVVLGNRKIFDNNVKTTL